MARQTFHAKNEKGQSPKKIKLAGQKSKQDLPFLVPEGLDDLVDEKGSGRHGDPLPGMDPRVDPYRGAAGPASKVMANLIAKRKQSEGLHAVQSQDFIAEVLAPLD